MSCVPSLLGRDYSVDFRTGVGRSVIAAGCALSAILTWLYRSFDTMRRGGLTNYSEPDFHGECPNCSGELKKAILFTTIEERCECGFWRPAEQVVAELKLRFLQDV